MTEAGFATHIGRRSSNQDNALLDPSGVVYAVADGVGGARAGEEAAAVVCAEVFQARRRGQPLSQGILNGHEKLRIQAREQTADQYSASTIACLELHKSRAEVAWVGDSRVYLSRGGNLLQMTQDHVVDGQTHVLTQALGAPMAKPIEIEHLEIDRQEGDVWLICSDGLYTVIEESVLLECLMQPISAQKIANELLDRALRGGADDNVTLVVVKDRMSVAASLTEKRSVVSSPAPALQDVATTAELPSGRGAIGKYLLWLVIAIAVAWVLNGLVG